MRNENILIKQAQNGDADAFQELVERYKKIVYYFAYDLTGHHENAEDLSQEVFIKTFRSLKSFRGDAKLSSWLYRITVNTLINQKRKKNYKLQTVQESLEEERLYMQSVINKPNNINPEKSAETALLQKYLQQALEKLSIRERSVFILRHYHDLKIKEIGDTLKLSPGTVKSYLFRAVKKLQKSLAFYRQDLIKE